MAFYRASIGGGGGGGETKTTLWTNPSPTSSMAAPSLSLSDDLTKYRYLEVEWRFNTSDATATSVRFLSSEFKTLGNNSTNSPKFMIGQHVGSGFYGRPICYESDTSIYVGQCRQLAGTGSASTSVIPTKISGIN